jgi:hypothetical protein
MYIKFKDIKKRKKKKKKELVQEAWLVPNQFSRQRNTFSSSCSTAFAISFFCSKTESSSNFGTLALITKQRDISMLVSPKCDLQIGMLQLSPM